MTPVPHTAIVFTRSSLCGEALSSHSFLPLNRSNLDNRSSVLFSTRCDYAMS